LERQAESGNAPIVAAEEVVLTQAAPIETMEVDQEKFGGPRASWPGAKRDLFSICAGVRLNGLAEEKAESVATVL
jgi:hypothetical protein